MTSAFLSIRDQIVTLLQQAPAVAGGRIKAGRAQPLPAEHTSDVCVALESFVGEPVQMHGAPQDWRVSYSVTVRARGSTATDPVTVLDPVLEAAYTRLAQATVPAGVMSWIVSPEGRPDIDEADTPIARLVLLLELQLRTAPDSLTLAT